MRIDAHTLREAARLSSRRLQDRTEQRGLCAGDHEHADDWFLPEPQAPSTRARIAYEREAERLCSSCPVRAECLELALRTEATQPAWGIWGGLAPWQRTPLVRARQRAAGADEVAATDDPCPDGGGVTANHQPTTAAFADAAGNGLPTNRHPGGVSADSRHLDAIQAVARGDVPPSKTPVTAGGAPQCAEQAADLRPEWFRPAEGPTGRHAGTPGPRADASGDDSSLSREHGRSDADRAADRAAAELKDWLSDAGTFVVAGTAGFSSWAGWVSLGRSVGWGSVGVVELAWLLPVSVDVYAFVALRTWNNARLPDATRTVGKVSAIGALALSIAGNAAGHAVEADTFAPNWIVVVLVASLAPILLFLTLHLRVLRTRDQAAAARAARERAERRAARTTTQSERQPTAAQSSPEQPTGRSRRPTSRPVDSGTPADRSSNPSDKSDRSGTAVSRPVDRSDQADRPVARSADRELVAQVLRLDEERGRPVGRDVIASRLHVGSGRATRLRQLADDQATTSTPDQRADR